MNNSELIKETIQVSIQVKEKLIESHIDSIEKASDIAANVLLSGGKLLFCGNGGSSCDASHIATELVVRFKSGNERKALPAISLSSDSATLTACGNDYGYKEIFSRQIEAFGKPEDLLFAITTSGNSENILLAVEKAKSIGMKTIALLGGTGGKLKSLCDHEIIVPSTETARIQESHILIGHIICSIIEKKLFDLN
ncbi:MAG: D-sedoheptulose 7-phosphate isomerase [Leptospiraceae bacterium]|nr:D-sedoheptulose 7-phosphate isomerase [Leptospiraceae bacterium]MCK6382479.1 D-sedoheptulose 7-phosphate isomerase [Leptospiraceae bacterium]NUM41934.1 D-sedoheptulose 7-phosphate isomerase [Leptospiraceae bacterium]